MAELKTVAEWMSHRGIGLPELTDASGIDSRVVEAICQGRYTPSPAQRERLAIALCVVAEEIAWGHVSQVEAMYGHGPQFGRSP